MAGRVGRRPPPPPRLLSLCSGIGGFDLAAEMAGWEIAGQCEIDPFCQRVLARHWPDVKRVADIRSVWGDSFDGAIDCIAAGFPCQPASVAGKRRGAADPRWLWPEVCRVIQIYEPAWVLLENVSGLISLGLDTVLADLAASGYESWPLVFPAAAVGAPHIRERVFIIGHIGHVADSSCGGWRQNEPDLQAGQSDIAQRGIMADAIGDGQSQPQRRLAAIGRWTLDGGEVVAYADSDRCGNGASQPLAIAGSRGTPHAGDADAPVALADATRWRLRRGIASGRARQPACTDEDCGGWQTQSRMGGDLDGLSRRLDGAGRADADDPLVPPRHAWPASRGDAQYAWEPPRTTRERIPNRAARLKALGNGVVPAQVYPILAAIRAVMEHEGMIA